VVLYPFSEIQWDYSAIKPDELFKHVTAMINLKTLILNERSQQQTITYDTIESISEN
jgi:hypothetical protein